LGVPGAGPQVAVKAVGCRVVSLAMCSSSREIAPPAVLGFPGPRQLAFLRVHLHGTGGVRVYLHLRDTQVAVVGEVRDGADSTVNRAVRGGRTEPLCPR
jgi:hypothetical protein